MPIIFMFAALGIAAATIVPPARAAEAAALFRVMSPTTTVITAFSPDGAMVWSNAAVGVTGRIQRATTLMGPGNWMDFANYIVTDPIMSFVPSALSDTSPSVQVTVADVALTPGADVTFRWQAQGRTNDLQLVFCLHAPGTVYTVPGGLSQLPGTRPANGAVSYLRPDRTWNATRTHYAETAAPGSLTVPLPSAETGEWRLDVLLQEPSGGAVKAVASQAFLVSAGPALRLRLSRPVASLADPVRAEVMTSAGVPDRPVKLLALLTLADGTEVSLPSWSPRLTFAYEGPSTNAQFKLFDDLFLNYGEGTYRLSSRLLDGETGALLGMASADFLISDAMRPLLGVVYSATGQPLGGGGPGIATVSAFDVDDAATTVTGPIDAEGRYALSLPAGRYLLSARVADAQGYHVAIDGNVLLVTARGLSYSLDLRAQQPVQTDAGVLPDPPASAQCDTTPPAVPPTSLAMTNASSPNAVADGLPKPKVMIVTDPFNVTTDDLIAILNNRWLEKFRDWVTTAAGSDVTFAFHSEVIANLTAAATAISNNPTANVDLGGAIDRLSTEFTLLLSFKHIVDVTGSDIVAPRIEVSVIRNVNSQVIFSSSVHGSSFSGGLVLQLASQTGIGLFEKLRAAQDRPILPVIQLAVAPFAVPRMGNVEVTGTLKEKTGELMPDRAIQVTHSRPADLWEDELPLTTDPSGVFRTTVNVGTRHGIGTVRAACRTFKSPVKFYAVLAESELALDVPAVNGRIDMQAGESKWIYARVRYASGPVPGAAVDLTVFGGTLDVARVVTTSNGEGAFLFTAGSTNGMATIRATYLDSQQVPPVLRTAEASVPIYGGVVADLSATATNVVNGALVGLTEDVQVQGSRVPGLPVHFSLRRTMSLSAQDEGVLEATDSQTDENGQVHVFYLAPTNGTGSAIITVETTVEDQTYTNEVTITFRPPPYSIIELGAFYPVDINNRGQVIGRDQTDNGVLWENGTVRAVPGYVVAINNAGVIALNIWGNDHGNHSSFTWSNGVMTQLEKRGAFWPGTQAYDINDAGQVAGETHTYDILGTYTNAWGELVTNFYQSVKAARWENGSLSAQGEEYSSAYAINSAGTMAGDSSDNGLGYATMWRGSSATTYGAGSFKLINDAEACIGLDPGGYFFWRNGASTYLGHEVNPKGINNSAVVVGYRLNSSKGFRWSNGVMEDLKDLIPADSGWSVLSMGCAINDLGQILGYGVSSNGARAFLLTPCSP